MRRGLQLVLVPALLVATATACADDDGGDLAAFCATAEAFAVDNPAAALGRYDPSDRTGAAAQLRDAGARLETWAGEAPGDIAEDVTALAEAMSTLADEFETPGDAPGDSLEEQLAEVEAASGRVVTFTRDRCQVDLEPPGDLSSTSSTTTPAG
jgi:hypothetical protein